MNRTRTALAIAVATLGLAAVPAVAAGADAQGCNAPHCALVDSTVDAVDANVGDGICGTAAGECTLRAAVQEGRVGFDPDTDISRIAVPPGVYRLTLHGAGEDEAVTGDLDVTQVNIVGSGVGRTIVDGDGADRVFEARSDASIEHLTVRGGRVVGAGGGILAGYPVRLEHLEVTGNEAMGGPDDHPGDGRTPGYGGGIDTYDTSVRDTRIHHNVADYGGGMNWGLAQAGFGRVTLDHNHARVAGGGLRLAAYDAYVDNITVSANTAGARGGGIEIPLTTSYWALTMDGFTVTGNAAPEGGGIWLAQDSTGPRRHAGFVVADNEGGDCGGLGTLDYSRGGNIDSDGTCGFTEAGDQSDVNPKLGPLQDNGGPTPTHALLPGSPAIDAWPCTYPRDQRGATRPSGDACDAGAFEVGPCCPAFEIPTYTAPARPPKGDPPGSGDPGPGSSDPGPPPGTPNSGPQDSTPVFTCGIQVAGTRRGDTLRGDGLRNSIDGLRGNDRIFGLGGDDCLFGGVGNDTVVGGDGDDELHGDAGNDVLKGNAGADQLFGASGNDRLVGGAGNDTVSGGAGNDVIDSRGSGFDAIDCGPGRDKALVGDLDRVRNCERVINVD
jgi:hypothetical protein